MINSEERRFCHFCGESLTQRFIEGRTRYFCVHCDRPIYENPIPATCLVVINENKELLMVKRSVEPKLGEWCLPGGFMELGETPESCALRELKEETGLNGKISRLLGVIATPGLIYNTILMMGFLVKNFSGVLAPGDDASQTAFFANAEIPPVAFETHLNFIRIYYAEHGS